LEGLDSLAELALDLRWSWNHRADEVLRLLAPALWELTQNPWVVLQAVPRNRLEQVLADPAFREKIYAPKISKHPFTSICLRVARAEISSPPIH